MLGTQRVFPDGQCSFEIRLGLGVATLGSVQRSQIVDCGRDIGMVRPEPSLQDREGALEIRLGLGVTALRPVGPCKVIQADREIGIIGVEYFFAYGQSPLEV